MAVVAESADERIEVAATKDAVLTERFVEFVARHSILVGVYEDGEVAVVVSYSWHIVEKAYAGYVSQRFAVADGYLVAVFDGRIDFGEVEETIGTTYFVHFAIDARGHYFGLVLEPEILQVVDMLFGGSIVADQRTPLYGVEHFGGVEAERGHVAPLEDGLAVGLHTESMCGIVYHFQSMAVRYLLDALNIAGFPIAMDGHDGGGARSDGCLNPVGVDAAVGRVDIDEDGSETIPPDAVGGGYEAVWGGDDFALDVESLEGCEQWQCAVGEETDVWNFKVLAQCLFQQLVVMSVVGNPLARPDLFQQVVKLVEVGQERSGDSDVVALFHGMGIVIFS